MAVGVRVVQKVSSTRGFAKVAPYVIPALDRAVHRLTRGKVLLSAQMLPGIVLTSTGARSGLARRAPLACMPEEGGRSWILVGSNFGRPGHPAWTHNLLARPEARISWKGEDIPVTARLLEGRSGRPPGRRCCASGRRTRRTRRGWSGRSGSSGWYGADHRSGPCRRPASRPTSPGSAAGGGSPE